MLAKHFAQRDSNSLCFKETKRERESLFKGPTDIKKSNICLKNSCLIVIFVCVR